MILGTKYECVSVARKKSLLKKKVDRGRTLCMDVYNFIIYETFLNWLKRLLMDSFSIRVLIRTDVSCTTFFTEGQKCVIKAKTMSHVGSYWNFTYSNVLENIFTFKV